MTVVRLGRAAFACAVVALALIALALPTLALGQSAPKLREAPDSAFPDRVYLLQLPSQPFMSVDINLDR